MCFCKSFMDSLIRKNFSIAALIFAMGAPVAAYEISGDVALLSDYKFRGISQTSRNPAVQGGVSLGIENWSFGVWGSNVDFSEDPQTTTYNAPKYVLTFLLDDNSMLVPEDGCNDVNIAGCNPTFTRPDTSSIAGSAEVTFIRDALENLVLVGGNPAYVVTTTTSGASTSAELDAFIGYSQQVSERFGWSVSYVQYIYPGYSSLDYPELLVDFSISDFTIGLVYSNDYFASKEAASVISANYSRSFGDMFSLDLSYATTSADANLFGTQDNYSNYSIALGLDTETISFGFAWEDTNLNKGDCGGNDCDSTLVFSIGKGF